MPDYPDLNPQLPTRVDLVARLDLMEAMIAEGREATARCGWIFVLWGIIDLVGIAVQRMYPQRIWNWPVVISLGWLLQFAGFSWKRRRGEYSCRPNLKGRSMAAIWGMMGVTLSLYCVTGIFTHHGGGVAYLAAIFMIVGMAHATSAIILRWRAQGAVAALWWAGGVAVFFLPLTRHWPETIFALEMLFGMVFFGLYMMFLERRTPPGATLNA
ncbi:MAG TPA: hypothetical protein VII58_02050 [Acidobacteriaceae bacterium]